MLSLKDFIDGLDQERSSETSDGDVVRTKIFGLDVAAVLLPSDVLSEERVERMNQFWDLLVEREALVIAAQRNLSITVRLSLRFWRRVAVHFGKT